MSPWSGLRWIQGLGSSVCIPGLPSLAGCRHWWPRPFLCPRDTSATGHRVHRQSQAAPAPGEGQRQGLSLGLSFCSGFCFLSVKRPHTPLPSVTPPGPAGPSCCCPCPQLSRMSGHLPGPAAEQSALSRGHVLGTWSVLASEGHPVLHTLHPVCPSSLCTSTLDPAAPA